MTRRNRLAKARAELGGAGLEFARYMQVFQGHALQDLAALVTEHLFSTDVEGGDDATQVSGDDRDLGRGIQHTAQLAMGTAQLLLPGAQFTGAQLHQFQGPLPLADQHIEQGAEQQTEQAAEYHHSRDRRMIGRQKHPAGSQLHPVIAISQAQQAGRRQIALARRVAGLEQCLLAVFGRRVHDPHRQIVVTGRRQPVARQLPHADDRHHIPERFAGRRPDHRRDQQ
ncbi:hypothetical protein D3C76_1251740 [compost metagenome]